MGHPSVHFKSPHWKNVPFVRGCRHGIFQGADNVLHEVRHLVSYKEEEIVYLVTEAYTPGCLLSVYQFFQPDRSFNFVWKCHFHDFDPWRLEEARKSWFPAFTVTKAGLSPSLEAAKHDASLARRKIVQNSLENNRFKPAPIRATFKK